jgi:uncharacterized membrane protein SpoIIM required for sporulation
MVSNGWIAVRRADWDRLDALTREVDAKGLKDLSGDDLRDFGLLYRRAAADLSAVRTDRTAQALSEYLNRLVSRAHNHVYSGQRTSLLSVWKFLSVDFPRLFRKLFPYVAISVALCLLGALLGSLESIARPQFMRATLGPDMVATIERHEMWTKSVVSAKPQESSRIMTNNISVTFMVFAGGILAGLPTIFMLFWNGMSVGIIATACAQHGMALDLWSFVAAHGALELPSIFIAGGAGLRIASGLLFPGMLSRRNALALAGSEASRLLGGTIPMLFVAGTLEAFLSPTSAPIAVKFSVGALLFTALCYWLSEGGRERDEQKHSVLPDGPAARRAVTS